MLDTAAATLPATWLPPADPAPLVDALRAAGWHADLYPEEKELALARAEAVLPLPERVELDPAEAPDGLALRVGWWRDPDTEEQGWAWWDPDAADPHLLCVGPTRSGKSVALRCAACSRRRSLAAGRSSSPTPRAWTTAGRRTCPACAGRAATRPTRR